MQLQHDDIKLGLAQAIDQALRKQGVELSSETIYDQIGKAPNIEMGHFAYPCFDLAKQFRKAPPLIAKELSAQIEPDRLIASVEAAGPYVNFFVNPQAMGDLVALPILDGRFFRKDLTRDTPKMMVEYSQPNTHKELHVGHMRNLSLGDALIRILQYAGNEVISSTFPGDVGTHVAKCLWYIKYHNTDPMPDTEKGAWLGRMYTLGSLKLEDELGSPQEAINRQQLSGILSQLEAEEGEFFDLWKETRQWSIDLFNWVYDWAGVTFDKWYWESEVDVPSVAYAKTLLQRGIAIESQGAIGVDLSEYNLDFCVLIKSDGHGLYATKDLELARRKFEDFHIERSIYVVDVRQSQHFQQVFKVLELAGFEEAEQCYHLAYNFVELPDGPMSSRKGNIIAIMDLIRQMVDRVIR
ncbi:MAG: arginine--tRNA ligase, partial [Saprospiraceae bacterium]|nr:arginine--tRNA ligase [Saprospiraceae bacterium]